MSHIFSSGPAAAGSQLKEVVWVQEALFHPFGCEKCWRNVNRTVERLSELQVKQLNKWTRGKHVISPWLKHR